jgi:hypothetical protein
MLRLFRKSMENVVSWNRKERKTKNPVLVPYNGSKYAQVLKNRQGRKLQKLKKNYF